MKQYNLIPLIYLVCRCFSYQFPTGCRTSDTCTDGVSICDQSPPTWKETELELAGALTSLKAFFFYLLHATILFRKCLQSMRGLVCFCLFQDGTSFIPIKVTHRGHILRRFLRHPGPKEHVL